MKWRDALGVSADAIAVGTFVAGVVILALSIVNDVLIVGLGAALLLSVALNVVLVIRLRRKAIVSTAPVEGPQWYEASTSVVQTYKATPEEREAASEVIAQLDIAMDRFEYDNAHGLTEAGDEARIAARKAKSVAERITNEKVRDSVTEFELILTGTPRGWVEKNGATRAQMFQLREAHGHTVRTVGALLRPAKP